MQSVSSMSGEINQYFFFLLGLCAFTAVLIFALLIGFSIKYRSRPGRTEAQPVVQKRILVESIWIGLPLVTFLLLFVWGAELYFKQMRIPADTLSIYTVGQQWMWKFQHQEGVREINELHVPVGRPVSLTMTSQDVIHSFFVPAFRTKMDVVPGRYTQFWFEAKKPGRYRIFCSQYCGTWHSRMTGFVVAMPQDKYEDWLLKGRTQRMAEKGKMIFQERGCMQCHGFHSSIQAPDLHGLFGSRVQLAGGQTILADENYIEDAIVYPGRDLVQGYANIMPTYKKQLSQEEINDLIEYIKSLSQGFRS